jgi:hypothetical protein
LEELNFEENDSLIIDKNIRLEIAAGIEAKIKGYFYCSADSIAITAIDKKIHTKVFGFTKQPPSISTTQLLNMEVD